MNNQDKSPSLDTAKSSLSGFTIIPNNGSLVEEPISPLQDHSTNLSGRATSLSERDFSKAESSKEGKAPSSVISISSDDREGPTGNVPSSAISIASDDCVYLGESFSPASKQAASNSVVATVSNSKGQKETRRKKVSRIQKALMPYNNTAIPPSEEITGSTALPCMAILLYLAQLETH